MELYMKPFQHECARKTDHNVVVIGAMLAACWHWSRLDHISVAMHLKLTRMPVTTRDLQLSNIDHKNGTKLSIPPPCELPGPVSCLLLWVSSDYAQPITGHRARFLSLARSKLRLCSANHMPGYWSILPCDWPSTAWAYSEQETENGPRLRSNLPFDWPSTAWAYSKQEIENRPRSSTVMIQHGQGLKSVDKRLLSFWKPQGIISWLIVLILHGRPWHPGHDMMACLHTSNFIWYLAVHLIIVCFGMKICFFQFTHDPLKFW